MYTKVGLGLLAGVSVFTFSVKTWNELCKVPELKPVFEMPFNLYRQGVKYNKNEFTKYEPKKVTILAGADKGMYNSLVYHEYFDGEKKNEVNLLVEDLKEPLEKSLAELLNFGIINSKFWRDWRLNKCLTESKYPVNIVIDDPDGKFIGSEIYHELSMLKNWQKSKKANIYICTKMTREIAEILELEYKEITIDD